MEKFKLIDGVFNAVDAKEILLTLIDKKIKFHELKSFSNEIKAGSTDGESLERVEELKKTRDHIILFLKDKLIDNLSFNIKSFIEMEEVDVEVMK
ncbi:hypothetical protein I5M32_10830 [Pedobacter sp. SD-b]|uniref:Uncharacterized protein n=1 Tax=Pedobacter segetis TaxID=2793069 RepID=A0ABS1BKN6_9SPHI|nr:hypothetical protein [Pedobacter segetis]MBK0383455.1 hypothetical protein [Pedobacter segetis]